MFNDNTLDFIDCVTRGRMGSTGYFWRKDTGETLAFDEGNYALQFTAAEALRAETDIYIGLGGVNGLRSGNKRATNNSVVQFPGLFIDVDVKRDDGEAHAQTALPGSRDEALDFIRSLPLKTSWINFSGYGYHCYWWVQDTDCSDPSRRKAFQAELHRASAEVLHLAATRGWKLDKVSDLGRITRVPGGMNHKRGRDALVEVEVFERDGPEYASIEELKFCDLPPRLTKTAPSATRLIQAVPAPSPQAQKLDLAHVDSAWNKALEDSGDGEGLPPGLNFAAVAQGCRFVGDALDRAARLPEPEWFTLLGVVGHCHGGDKLAHVISSQDTRYNHAETATKLEQALAYDVNCGKVAERHLGACDGCAFRDLVHRPAELGRFRQSTIELCGSYAFDPVDDRFVD